MERLREEVRQLKQSVELVVNTMPPLSEFKKYEVLDMLDILHNKAADGNPDKKEYYRLVYQTVREKVDSSKDHFKDLVMRLLGDKSHEKVLFIVCKVENSHRRKSREKGVEVPVWHVLHALSTCDAIFVIGGVILRLTAPIGSPVIPNRLPYQTTLIGTVCCTFTFRNTKLASFVW